jgi:hypothetical protein
MSEIKFRAWNYKKGKLTTWKELCNDTFAIVNGMSVPIPLGLLYDDSIKWMQYIGLKDWYKNDIIEYYSGEQGKKDSFYKMYGIITFDQGSFKINNINISDINSFNMIQRYRSIDSGGDVYYENKDFKKVGNVYEATTEQLEKWGISKE